MNNKLAELETTPFKEAPYMTITRFQTVYTIFD